MGGGGGLEMLGTEAETKIPYIQGLMAGDNRRQQIHVGIRASI